MAETIITSSRDAGRRINSRQVCDRLGICDRTLDRWLLDPELQLPKPVYIRTRRYWIEDQITAFVARQAAGVA